MSDLSKVFFATIWVSFSDGGMPLRSVRKIFEARGITLNYFAGARDSRANSPPFKDMDLALAESDCAIFYFGDPAAIKEPYDDHSYDLAARCAQSGRRVLIYASRKFPAERLVARGLSVSSKLIDDEAELESQLQADFKKPFTN